MPDRQIPYGRQWIDEDDIEAVVDVLRSDYLTTGPAVEVFERALEATTGASHAVAVSSGTSALHAMYFAMGVGLGDEVITSPLTFAATANAALYLGASIRFVDVSPDTGCIDPEAITKAMTEQTRLVCAVDYAGHPADYDAILGKAGARDVAVVSDASHALGASYKGRRVGAFSKAASLSFHPVKPITTAEGGAVLTDDDEVARRAARFRTHGFTRDRASMERYEGPWYHEQHDLGYNYRLSDLQAALGHSQLRRLDAMVTRRRQIAARYLAELSDIGEIQLPAVRPNVEHAWHIFVVRVERPERRRAFFERLHGLGVLVQVHYIPVYHHPFYARLGFERGACPVAEDFSARAVTLPLFPQMTDADVDRVIDSVRRASREVL